MRNNIIKSSLICLVASLSALPSFAGMTNLSMNASANDILVVQIERASDNTVVSPDDFQASPSDPIANEILNFGNVDARGLSNGSLVSNNGLTSGSLERVILDSDRNVFNVLNPPSRVAGALYFIRNAYQIRTVRTPDTLGKQTTDVDVYNDGDLKTYVDLAGANTFSTGSTISASSLRAEGSGVAAKNLIKANVVNNDPFLIDIGIYVENSTGTGTKSSTITFTGT